MEFVVVWTDFAERKLKEVFIYYQDNASLQVALQISRKIVTASIVLERHPFLGTIEPLLESRVREYRYLLEGRYKLLYFVNQEKKEVVVVNLFDTRQNPLKIEESK